MEPNNITIKGLLEAGIHFGHKVRRWNPKMAPYIYGQRNGIHILDLQQTLVLINKALDIIKSTAQKKLQIMNTAKNNKRIIELINFINPLFLIRCRGYGKDMYFHFFHKKSKIA